MLRTLVPPTKHSDRPVQKFGFGVDLRFIALKNSPSSNFGFERSASLLKGGGAELPLLPTTHATRRHTRDAPPFI